MMNKINMDSLGKTNVGEINRPNNGKGRPRNLLSNKCQICKLEKRKVNRGRLGIKGWTVSKDK